MLRHLTSEELLKEYYDSIKKNYKGINFKQFKHIIETQYSVLKESMRCNDFPSVRIKHLGTFCVPNSLKRKHEETMDYFKKYYDEFNKEYKEGSTESK